MSSVLVEDPDVKYWKPTKKQEMFLKVPFSVNEGFFAGAAGPGKTECLILLTLIYGFYNHPLYKGILLRRTFPELESEVIMRSREWYPSTGAVYNESKHRWQWRNGAIFQFGHAESENDIRKYDSAQYNLAMFDEATSFTQFQYEHLSLTRVRSRTADLPAITRSASNPGNIGHAYFRERFVDPWKFGNKILVSKNGLKRIYIPATMYDNPHLMANSPEYEKQLMELPEAERRAKLLGDWYTFSGQVFREWRIEPLIDEPANAQHVIDSFEIPLWWPRIIAIDWGHRAYCWIGWFAISPDGRVYLYKEYAEKEKKIKEWIRDMLNLTPEVDSVVKVRICHSANQDRGEEENIETQVNNALRMNSFKCSLELGAKDRIGGKMLVHEYLRWKPIDPLIKRFSGQFNPELAQTIFRNQGKSAYDSYVNMFEEKVENEILPKLQIFKCCNKIIDCIPNCIYDDKKKDKLPEDVKEFNGDDPYDGLRIGLGGIKDYMISNAADMAKYKLAQEAINALQNGNDQTSFYRKMEYIETKNKEVTTIRRRRFGRRNQVRRMYS